MDIDALRMASREIEIAYDDFFQTVKRELPIGSEIKWAKRRNDTSHVQSGTVEDVLFDGSIYVRNLKTGKNTHITVYDVILAGEKSK